MARTNATNFSGGLQFPIANAAADLFKKEDVQTLALAVDGHDHSAGKGLALPAGAIPSGLITSAMIADGTIAGADIAFGAINGGNIAANTIAGANIAALTIQGANIADNAITSSKIQDLTIGAADIAYHAATYGHFITGTTGGQSTTSSSPVTIPEMTLTFNVGGIPATSGQTCEVLVMFSGTFYFGAANVVGFVGLTINGVAYGNVTLGYGASLGTYTSVAIAKFSAPLATGNNTVTATWSTNSGAVINNLNAERFLVVIEHYR